MEWPAYCKGPNNIPTLECIPTVFGNIVEAAIVFAGVVAVFFIVYAGIKFINSRGDPKQVEGARQTLTYAIIGLIVVLLAFLIISLIGFVTGVGCINLFGFESCK